MRALIRWVLNHRWWVIGAYVCLTVLATYTLTNAIIGSSIGKLFFGDSPQFQRYLEYTRDLTSDEQIIVGLDGVDLFKEDTVRRLSRTVEAIREITLDYGKTVKGSEPPPDDFFADFGDGNTPQTKETGVIKRVSSVLGARDIRLEDGRLTARTFGDLVRSQPERADEIRATIQSDPFTRHLMISKDGQHIAVIIELHADPDRPAERLPDVIDDIRATFVKNGFHSQRIHFAGLPALTAQMFKVTAHNLSSLLPITVLVLLITIYWIFRRLWPALLCGFVAFVGVLWTMGLSVAIDPQISVMHSIAPIVILIVATSDVIHLISAYLLELRSGTEKTDAIISSSADVGTACLYTSATTFMGFMALSFIPTPVFRQLGIILGAGVAFALIIAVTLLPIIFDILPTPREWTDQTPLKSQDILDSFLGWNARLVEKRPRFVVAVFVLISAVSAYGLTQLTIETRISERLAKSNEYAKSLDWFKTHFAQTNILQVVIDTGRAQGVLEPKTLQEVERIQKQILSDPRVSAAFSIADLIKTVDRTLNQPPGEIPTDRKTIGEYMFSLESIGRDSLNGLVDFHRQKAIVSIRMVDNGMRITNRAGLEFESLFRKRFDDTVRIEATGMLFMTGNWLTNVIQGQRQGLLFTGIMVTLMMLIALRRFDAGLWSMVPNALPLLMMGGFLGLFYDELDSDALVLAMLAIGIGVDDTIHFLMRLRLESSRCATVNEALERTYHYAGRAIVITTLVLTLGFLPMATSDYFPIRMYGTFLPLTLIFALVADLFLVPALCHLGWIRFPSKAPQT